MFRRASRIWQDPSPGLLLVGLWLACLAILVGGQAAGVIDVTEAARWFTDLTGPRLSALGGVRG